MDLKTLQDRQRLLEEEALQLGITRYRGTSLPWRETAKPREETELTPGKLLLKTYIEPLAEAIDRFVEEANSGKAGRKHTAVKYLANIDSAQAAYLTLRNAINAASSGLPLTALAQRIGNAIMEHVEMVAMAKDHPGLARKLDRQLAKTTSAAHRLGVLRHVRKKYDLATLKWSVSDRIVVGTKLAELAAEHTGLFAIERHSRGAKDTPYFLVFTPETSAWLEKTHGRCELLSPIHLPMVCPPRKWHTPYAGGYLTDILKPRLVHTRNRNHLDELGGVDLSRAMRAVNAIQETPWRISRKVLDVVGELLESGGNVAGLPRGSEIPLPPRPAGVPEGVPVENLTAAQREDLTTWKAKAAKTYAANSAAQRERVLLAQKLYVAERFAQEEAIWFPHYMDFRGRVYPMASYLTPQGDDVCRGLLEFGRGKPLGEDGAFWLAVHLSGLWGVDKVSFDDRWAWVQEHEEQILASALEPLEDGAFWTKAEKPFQALAACFDWLGYKVNGNDHVSHLPIAMDGSCSGLQHYSALLRDEVGGAAVNLVPSPTPADVYTTVADRAQVLSDGHVNGTDAEMARAWSGKFVRKVAKQPTMTLCYSATQFGMKTQVENALKKLDESGPFLPPEVDRYKAAIYATGILWDALGDTVIAARSAMEFLKKVAQEANKAGIPLRWTSPIGLPILQEYQESVMKRVRVYVGGRMVDLDYAEGVNKLAGRKQIAGVAPNFVHSLDAAHLLSTVNLAAVNGIEDFAMIHDSFGCHAADTTLLNAVLREAFVQQYSAPVLEQFRDEVKGQIEAASPDGKPAKLPALPKTGTLDLAAVRDSEFFFA